MVSIVIRIILYLIMFSIAMYSISGIRFDRFMDVTAPNKVRVLALLLAMSIAYLSSEFLMGLLIFMA